MPNSTDIQKQVDTHVRRMLEEEAQLSQRIVMLSTFISGADKFKQLPAIDQELLAAQLFVMQSYASILNTRLRLATTAGVTVPLAN